VSELRNCGIPDFIRYTQVLRVTDEIRIVHSVSVVFCYEIIVPTVGRYLAMRRIYIRLMLYAGRSGE